MPLMDEAFEGAPVLVTGGYGFIVSNVVRLLVTLGPQHLDAWNAQRRRLARRYNRGLHGTGVKVPVERPDTTHVYCSYAIRHPSRNRLREWLAERGIDARVQYRRPIHLQPAYRGLGAGTGSFPGAEQAAAEILSLPIFPALDESAIGLVCDGIRAFAA
jgi:dTDP-3-amino-2,3,6-trideoxy-4-keto-D-glucose/dTDP-3-amino-3,4,6-trideoxy-alpha-D-glucose/dTDP-2,6-dideoxy-D-kanosamine transaminase